MAARVYEAQVSRADDPEERGRIKVRCRGLLGQGVEMPDWLEPTFPFAGQGWGLFLLPAVGDYVEIEVTTGDSYDDVGGEAMLLNPEARWRSGLYRSKDDVPAEFRGKHYGKRTGLRGRGGQVLILDDDAASMILAASAVLLGGADADEQAALGNALVAHLSDLMDTLAAHTHTSAAPTLPTTPPINAASFAAYKASPLGDGSLLSGVVKIKA